MTRSTSRPTYRIALATLSIAAALGASLATGTSAQAYDGIDARQASEARRIEEGRRSGELSWREHRALKAQQARIAADERRARADGVVTPEERHRLNRELNQASHDVYRLKHNGEVSRRYWWNRWW
jgi:Spy/CpxP family protein refolding chaperone